MRQKFESQLRGGYQVIPRFIDWDVFGLFGVGGDSPMDLIEGEEEDSTHKPSTTEYAQIFCEDNCRRNFENLEE